MAIVVNNPAERTERVVETSDHGGWAVAVIVLLAVVVIGAFVWMRYYGAPAAQQTQTPGSAQINLTLPANSGSDNSGSTGGATTNTNANGGATAPAAQ